MEIGISTATLFGRQHNEDAVATLAKIDARVCEVFLESFCEYNEAHGRLINERKGNLKVHSIHTLNTHFEPQLFSVDNRSLNDALAIFENCLKVAKLLGATNYTLHGKARFKKSMRFDNYEEIGRQCCVLTSLAKKYGVDVCLENVEWAYYGVPGFFKNVSAYCPDLKSCLDIKQARESGFSYEDYIEDMGCENIKTVHLSDVDENGRTALPTKNGKFDFDRLFRALKYNGFKGNCILEVYKENFETTEDLVDSLAYLREIKEKIF